MRAGVKGEYDVARTSLWQSRWFQRWGLLVLIFLLAFLPRAIYPVSWPMQWYDRSIHFGDALLAKDWAGTFQRGHPGVTTMWLSGIGLKLFGWQQGLSSEQLLGISPAKPGVTNDAITAGVIPLALVIALCIVLVYFLMTNIAGKKIALVASCLLALDPVYITYSKVLHVDAMSATFMLVSVLGLLDYLVRGKRFALILSGVFAGLAFLSKSPSLFLIPYTALAVGMYKLLTFDRAKWRGWGHWLWEIIQVLLIWGGVAAVTFVVLWPAMWVDPSHALSKMGDRIFPHAENPHINPTFFNGEVTREDPGLPFYLATMGWKTTLVTLPMILAALVYALFRARRTRAGRLVWLLAAFIFFFTLQMGLSADKKLRYLLPVFPALSLVAAIGLVQVAKVVGRVRWWRERRWASAVFIGLLLVLQASITLSRHPYYGTHHNALLGGSKVAQRILPLQDQVEGVDLAAQYLNTLPRAQRARAAVLWRGEDLFRNNFVGLTTTFDDPQADYRVYFIHHVMRDLHSTQWEDAWNADRQTEPLWTVDFDGIPYVWVYGAVPEELAAGGPDYPVDYRLGEHIQLKGVRLSAETLAPGDVLTVVLLWESDGEVEQSYTVFCHLLSAGGELVAQRDGIPIFGGRPTPSWRAGEVMEDSYEIFLDSELAAGEYELSVGMYDYATMERLSVRNAAGEQLPSDRIVVGLLRVETPIEE